MTFGVGPAVRGLDGRAVYSGKPLIKYIAPMS